MTLPEDYAERVYAGVLGMAIGVTWGGHLRVGPMTVFNRGLGTLSITHDKKGAPTGDR